MHRYEELEKIYYKKKRNKYFIIFALIFLIVLFLVSYILYNNSFKTKEKKQISINAHTTMTKKIMKEDKNKTKEIKVNKKIVKNPKNIQKTNKLYFILPDINSTIIPIEKTTKKKKNSLKNKKIKKENNISKKNNNVIKPSKIVIKEKTISVKELIKRFNLNPTYDLAIMIAKYYFNHNEYTNSQIWAVKANNINPKKVDSWLLFADILLKENKKQKALQVLKIYIDQYGENDAIVSKIRSINE